MISIIVAKSINNIIGNNNQIPWHLSEDLKRFKKITGDNTVIMGRKTYESIGKPLPNRLNIVITKNNKDKFKNSSIIVVGSLNEALLKSSVNKDIFIIGGGQIYAESLENNIPDQIIVTEILKNINGDAYFPEINEKIYTLKECTEIFNSESGLPYQYKTFVKINSN